MITFTTDIDKAHSFRSHEAAAEFASRNHGAKGPIPIGWRLQGRLNLIGGEESTIIHLPLSSGQPDQYVESIDAGPDLVALQALGPEYGQTFGQDVDIVSDLIKALQQCDPQSAVRIQGYATETLHSIRNVRDTATTTGHPLVMIRSY